MIAPLHWILAALAAIVLHGAVLAFASPSPEIAMERSAGRPGAVWGLPVQSIADTIEAAQPPAAVAELVTPEDTLEHVQQAAVEPVQQTEITEPVELQLADAPEDTTIAEPVEARAPTSVTPETADAPAAAAVPLAPERSPTSEVAARTAWDGGIVVAAASSPASELVEPVETTSKAGSVPIQDVSPARSAVTEATPPAAEPAGYPEVSAAPDARVAALTSEVAPAVVEARDATIPIPPVRPADVPRTLASVKPSPVKPSPVKPAQVARAAPSAPTASASTGQRAAAAPAGEQVGSDGARQAEAGQRLVSSFAGQVASHLQRYKRYPPEASARRLTGTALITFSILNDGGVRSVRLARSSGQSVLDDEVIAMVGRAAPFPRIPPAIGQSSMTFTVPIRFAPR